LAFYFESWLALDEVINMAATAISAFRSSEKLVYFVIAMLKFYIREGYIGNIGTLCEIAGSHLIDMGQYIHAHTFYFTGLQYAIVTKNLTVY
jgi:hypothetical protein